MKHIFQILTVLTVAGLAVFWLVNSRSSSGVADGKIINKVTFVCGQHKTINAVFRDGNVELTLNDGRKLSLEQTIAASGVRYADEGGDIVFWNKGNTAFLEEKESRTYAGCVEKGEADLVHLELYRDKAENFMFRYPSAFEIIKTDAEHITGWSTGATKKGMLAVKLRLPGRFEPKTNFQEATFSVGWKDGEEAIHRCYEPPAGHIMNSGRVTLNGTTYLRSRFGNAGAGHFHEVTRYRTVRGNRCYSIEQMIHSTNIGAYAPEQEISRYDKQRVSQILRVMIETFTFTD